MNFIGKLINSGLTNSEIGYTLGQVASTRYEYKGHCTHEVGDRKCGFTTTLQGLNQCPKCSRALLWKKKLVDV
jgi:hypothetical protein